MDDFDGSGDHAQLLSYVSCIKVNGMTILPPLMTSAKRHEMRAWRDIAVEVERKNLHTRRESVSSDGISSVITKSTPARPMTLNLDRQQNLKVRETVEHRLANDQSDSDTESERKRWSPLQVSSLQDYRLEGAADSDSTLETPDTVTASPRLNRQASYTVLKPCHSRLSLPSPNHDVSGSTQPNPALPHSNTTPALNTSAELSSSRTNSGRRTWDLHSAQKKWKASRGLESDTESESCPVTPAKTSQSRGVPRANSVPSQQVPFEGEGAVSVPSSVRDQLSTLSDMMIALTLRHEQQRRLLQKQQEQERDKYEHLFTFKQRQILDFISSSASSLASMKEPASCPPSTAEDKTAAISFRSEPPTPSIVQRPNSSKSEDSKQNVSRKKPASDKVSLMDTDMDVSFIEDQSVPLKDDDCETWSLSSRASTISVEPVPSSQINGTAKHVYTDLPLCNKAAAVICAGAKGYLTRRLMETEPVKTLRRSLRDSIQVCKTLKTAPDLGSSDIKFMDGLRRQIFSDWDALYEIFMTKPASEQMAMISADRERLLAQKKSTPESGRRVSAATIKALQRKRVMSTSLTFPRSPSYRRSCFKMSNSVSGALPSCKGGGAESSGSLSRRAFVGSSESLTAPGRNKIRKKPTARARKVIRNRFVALSLEGPGTAKKIKMTLGQPRTSNETLLPEMANRLARKPPSPYAARGVSPARAGRVPVKSRSVDRISPNKPPSSRGSESGSDNLDQSVRKVIRNTSVPSVEDNINVCVRVRPLSNKELKTGAVSVIDFPGNGQIMVGGQTGPGQKPKLFSYNVVFQPGATQDDVLKYSGVTRLIEMAVEGFSCTAFCYGQTGSGKTHTLTGPPGLFDGPASVDSEQHGLVFRSFMYLFKLLQERKDFHFELKASFLEIYNEKVIDLLNPGSRKPLAVRWSKKTRGFFVENLFTVDCEELDDLLAVLEEGMKNRAVGSHNMNDYSSRSHTILTVHITSEQQVEAGVFISKQGKINFVDLAGSEMTKKTNSEGKTLEEANNINKSLMVLGYCIASLSDSKKKSGHIPYRDSKLTKLLADSLAGNGVTLMIACISPAKSNLSETVNTLRYAARAKKIRTKPIVVMDPREALIVSLKREIGALQSENDHLRTLLHLADESTAPILPSQNQGVHQVAAPVAVDADKLAEMSGTELSDLVKHYMTENDALRRENSDLFSTREVLMRDQDMVCRENERLLKKLEDVNSVCCRSPIIPARPTFSAEMLNASLNGDLDATWANGSLTSFSSSGSRFHSVESKLPEKIQKELNKRQIGRSLVNLAERRSNSGGSSAPKKKMEKVKSAEFSPVFRRADTDPTYPTTPSLSATPPISPNNFVSQATTMPAGSTPSSLSQDQDSLFGSLVSLKESHDSH